MKFWKRKHKIQINFKSGHSMTVKVSDFIVGKNTETAKLTEIRCEGMELPNFLFVDLEEIESIWKLS